MLCTEDPGARKRACPVWGGLGGNVRQQCPNAPPFHSIIATDTTDQSHRLPAQTPAAAPVTKPTLGTQISGFLLALTPLGLPPEALTFLFDHAFLQFLKQWRRRPEFLSDRNRRRLPAIDPAVGARQHQPLPAVRIDNLLDLWRRGDQVFVPEQSV